MKMVNFWQKETTLQLSDWPCQLSAHIIWLCRFYVCVCVWNVIQNISCRFIQAYIDLWLVVRKWDARLKEILFDWVKKRNWFVYISILIDRNGTFKLKMQLIRENFYVLGIHKSTFGMHVSTMLWRWGKCYNTARNRWICRRRSVDKSFSETSVIGLLWNTIEGTLKINWSTMFLG